ncbi:YciI family protein [uncultured Lutibacter sp.]|uniref:YciI family protein n=1 Tax=uncultured Lutibacter sp. TaxID=437739 RepID=UPI00262AEB26|nr:YciI family protein [uncultured Lutibacter sp.]
MKTILYITLISLVALSCTNTDKKPSDNSPKNNSNFNETLAKKLGADTYGMKTYVIAFLKKGPSRFKDSITSAKLQRAHLDNIIKLAEEGTLVLAGPFLEEGELRGIYIFDVKTIEEAKKLTETDPAIQAGSLKMDLKLWYGSAALLQINDIHQKIAKIKI